MTLRNDRWLRPAREIRLIDLGSWYFFNDHYLERADQVGTRCNICLPKVDEVRTGVGGRCGCWGCENQELYLFAEPNLWLTAAVGRNFAS